MSIATGFDFEPLPDGNVLIEFFGGDGQTFNRQVVTVDVMRCMAVVSALTGVALKKGPKVAEAVTRQSSDDRQERA